MSNWRPTGHMWPFCFFNAARSYLLKRIKMFKTDIYWYEKAFKHIKSWKYFQTAVRWQFFSLWMSLCDPHMDLSLTCLIYMIFFIVIKQSKMITFLQSNNLLFSLMLSFKCFCKLYPTTNMINGVHVKIEKW